MEVNESDKKMTSRSMPLLSILIDLQITFECDASQGRWIQAVDDFKIKDSLISCKIPIFPYPIRNATSVDIILRQKNYLIGVLKYSYLPNR